MQILVVDDEPIIRKGLARMLEEYPIPLSNIRTASNGIDALEIIGRELIDIVFTDIRMPRMDGLDLCREIHEKHDYIETVVISGYDDFAYVQKCMEYEVKHYLLKPVTTPDLRDVLDQIVKKRSKGYVSISKVEEWIEQAEQAMTQMKENETNHLLQEWKETCLASEVNLNRLQELLEECTRLLSKRLTLPLPETSSPRFRTKEEVFADFENRVKRMAVSIAEHRTGMMKDPMQEVKAYIDSHLSEEITLEEVADRAGLTPNYFSSLFKKMTNETFVQYRIKKRMERAQELLAQPNARVVDVALEVGYEDYPHFTKMFKKMTGYTPTEYRAMLGIK